MDRFRQKSKKDKPTKYVDKEKSPSFIADVKTLKENIKIREILRTVKMNSSMRIKAPKGSKVMQNKDFNDNEDLFDEMENVEADSSAVPSATNPDVVLHSSIETNETIDTDETLNEDCANSDDQLNSSTNTDKPNEDINVNSMACSLRKSSSIAGDLCDYVRIDSSIEQNNIQESDTNVVQTPLESPQVKARDRKLSLDQTMLTRRGGFSQSELDLHSIGKSPLERKSSFFRKKMDSFLKNTTEIFKRQSFQTKNPNISRRGSMSVSLQSLNENGAAVNAYNGRAIEKGYLQESNVSLQSSLTAGCSMSSLSASQSDRPPTDLLSEEDSLTGSQPALVASQPLCDHSSSSINSLNEACLQEALLNRAISMSSGLDSAHGQGRRKASKSNRVTWLASEGLTNYFRRVIQDEKTRQMQVCHSYQDFSTIPENNLYGPKVDSKGRRLSYQRAVSGEDPVPPSRYQDSSLRRKALIPENLEANFELSALLTEFTKNGVPPIRGFALANICKEAFDYLVWAEEPPNLEQVYDCKKLPSNEEARQAVVRELVNTESIYIRHLTAIVEVFIAAAHALQDMGKLLEVDTERLFTNIPDVLNASLHFWELTFYPMIIDAVQNKVPFNTELMSPGFCRFRDLFYPYEKYVNTQSKALDYFRSLSSNPDFIAYISWCHAHKSCNRLQLSDIMVKPMQRLTKYALIIRRIITHTDTEPERTSLIAMESFAKNYVIDINRTIRQREEIEKIEMLSNIIESYEVEFKDEDLDRCFRMYANLNLKAPMVNCIPSQMRTLIYEGDLRFKDSVKEIEVRAFLLTDMLLICKKISKGSTYQYKMIRPKFMVDKIVPFPKYNPRTTKDLLSLVYVVVDEVGSAYNAFALSEPSKESGGSLRLWEQKVREARLTYDLSVWYARNPSRDISEMEMDSSSDYAMSATGKGIKQSSEDLNIEREARERVAAMLHRNMGASTEYDFSQASMNTDSFDGMTSGGRTTGLHSLRYQMHRTSTGSSRNSRLSSFQHSVSAASHDEPQPGTSKAGLFLKAGPSVEHPIPALTVEDGESQGGASTITVNVVSESESETVVQGDLSPVVLPVPVHVPGVQPPPPVVVLQHPSPYKPPMRSVSATRHTLRVQPKSGIYALVHSLPDLTIDQLALARDRHSHSAGPPSASEKLYQSHQELLQKNRLSTSQNQYLSPDHRSASQPPSSPSRASLKRGLAFSYSFKNPPLHKMGHVNSQSQAQAEPTPSTSQPSKPEIEAVSPQPGPSTSTDKAEKKTKQVSTSRNKDKNKEKGKDKEKGKEKDSDKDLSINKGEKESSANSTPSRVSKEGKSE